MVMGISWQLADESFPASIPHFFYSSNILQRLLESWNWIGEEEKRTGVDGGESEEEHFMHARTNYSTLYI